MSLGTEAPFGGSITTKKLPVPTSGLLQTETVRFPILRFSMMGYGGPMCAQAGAPAQIISRATTKHLVHGTRNRYRLLLMLLASASAYPAIIVARISIGCSRIQMEANSSNRQTAA